jgi:hypothetical protein
MWFDWYLSCAQMVCFDNESDEGSPPEEKDTQKPTELEIKPPAEFSTDQQKKFNEAVAAEKRKWQATLQKTEQTYKDLLNNSKDLSEKDRKTLEENLATLSGQLRSTEEEAKRRLKETETTYQQKLKDAEARAEHAETRYRESTITRALLDAGHTNEAFNPNQIVTLLRSMTKMVEVVDETTGKATGQFKVVVDFLDKDATTGKEVPTVKSPEEAVKRMKELPEWKNLFKHNLISGIGGNSAIGGLSPGTNGRIDPRGLTQEQYREVREKNPELLGLRPKGQR